MHSHLGPSECGVECRHYDRLEGPSAVLEWLGLQTWYTTHSFFRNSISSSRAKRFIIEFIFCSVLRSAGENSYSV